MVLWLAFTYANELLSLSLLLILLNLITKKPLISPLIPGCGYCSNDTDARALVPVTDANFFKPLTYCKQAWSLVHLRLARSILEKKN